MKLKYKNLYTTVLNEYETLSTCDRLHVAALLVKDGRILSVGYNGVPQGQPHCTCFFKHEDDKYYIAYDEQNPQEFKEVTESDYRFHHHQFSEKCEIHAEMNCLAFALRNNISVSDCEMVLSVAPCINCAKLIASSGIKTIHYVKHYDRSSDGEDFLKLCGISCEKL